MADATAYLLRGVNLGARNKIAMSTLTALALELGAEQPSTVGNSGNLVVRTAPSTFVTDLEHALADHEVATRAIPATYGQLIQSNEQWPWAGDEFRVRQVCFFSRPLGDEKATTVNCADVAPDHVLYDGQLGFLGFTRSTHRSRLSNSLIERLTGVASTTRTLKTVSDIVARIERLNAYEATGGRPADNDRS